MNEVIKAIFTRRSVRSFKPDQIQDTELRLIIDAARMAPSAMNLQPWHFTVVQNKSLLNEISEEVSKLMSAEKYLQTTDKNSNIFYNAPTVIFVSGHETSSYAETDCSLAAENMVLAAHSIGIGSCFVGSFNVLMSTPTREKFIEALAIPRGYKLFGPIAFGYPLSAPEEAIPERKKDIVTLLT